jgi:glycosyltransferase involved in cell wall biosynthesis
MASYFGASNTAIHPSQDYDVGYPAACVAHDEFLTALDRLLGKESPDVVLTQAIGWSDIVAHARMRRVPSILYVHGDEVTRLPIPEQGADLVLFNSAFTRHWLHGRFPFTGDIFHPPVALANYRTRHPDARSGALTLINPLPVKGGDLLTGIARALPERDFLAVEGWMLPPFLARALEREPNIEVVRWVHDMRRVFERTSVLLAPSRFEPFGRAPVEAAASGIPTLSSGVGGLRESVGFGGRVVEDSENVDAWVTAIRELEGQEAYRRLSILAKQHAARFDSTALAGEFIGRANELLRPGQLGS